MDNDKYNAIMIAVEQATDGLEFGARMALFSRVIQDMVAQMAETAVIQAEGGEGGNLDDYFVVDQAIAAIEVAVEDGFHAALDRPFYCQIDADNGDDFDDDGGEPIPKEDEGHLRLVGAA